MNYVLQKVTYKIFNKGSCSTDHDFKDLKIIKPHSHLSNESAIEISKTNSEVKRKALDTEKTPQKIFAEAVESLDDDNKILFESEETVKRLIRYHDAKISQKSQGI